MLADSALADRGLVHRGLVHRGREDCKLDAARKAQGDEAGDSDGSSEESLMRWRPSVNSKPPDPTLPRTVP